jgi:cytochrome c peroxidase
MHGSDLSDGQLDDLVAYLESLQPPPPPQAPDDDATLTGRLVFEQHGCVRCHALPAYTSGATYDVGLRDEWGRSQFNPPSLAGVGQRNRFFHDGRANSLDEVLRDHQGQLAEPLSMDESAALANFLRSL